LNTTIIYVFSILFSLTFVLFVLQMVRKRKLREQYSIMWILLALVIVVVSVKSDWLDKLSHLVGIYYPPSLLFLIALLFCFAYMLHLTVVISKLSDRVVRLTQEVSIHRQREEAEKRALREGVKIHE